MGFRAMLATAVLAVGLMGMAQPATADVRMFVRHEVADYGNWRKAYDAFDATRRKLGVISQSVYRSADDPNDITVVHDFRTLEQAKAFAASAELKSAMENAGVKGPPQIWYTTHAPK